MAADLVLKFLLLGDSGIGKSQILIRYAEDAFARTSISTIGVDFKTKNIELQGKKIKLQIWDPAGLERFREIIRAYFRGVKGIILVYDIASQKSFDNLPYWFEMIGKYAPDAEVLLVGNKSDLDSERVISTERGQHLASSLGISFRETCPSSDITSVNDAFDTLTRAVLAKAFDTLARAVLAKDINIERKEEEKKAGGCRAM